MIGRLLWKEFREGWLVLLISVIAPWAIFSVALTIHDPDLRQVFEVAGGLCSPSAIMLWAASKGGRSKDEGKLPLAHLPANPTIERLISLVIPLAVSALAGAWLGAVAAGSASSKAEYMRFGALYMSVAFAGCYLISAAISTWAGIAAGIVWAMFGLAWIDNVCRGISLDPEMKSFVLRSALGLAVCLVLFLLLAHKKRLRIAQVSSISLLIIVMFGPPVYDIFQSIPHPVVARGFSQLFNSDRSLLIMTEERSPNKMAVHFVNNISGLSSTKVFDGEVRPIVFDARGYGYLAQHIPKSGQVHIIAWNGKQEREVARMPAGENAWGAWVFPIGSVSPDGSYFMINLGTFVGEGIDVWIANLRTGETWIAFPNRYDFTSRVSWLDNKLALSGDEGISTVDLHTKKTGFFEPGVNGGNK